MTPPDLPPQFETTDVLGTTSPYQGTVGTSPIDIPTSPGNDLAEVLIRCATDNSPPTKRLLFSPDAGTTFLTLAPGEAVGWSFKGGIKQIQIKGNTTGVIYELLVNREP